MSNGPALPLPKNHAMTKRNIVRRFGDKLDRLQLETMQIVQNTLDAITNVLAEEGRVEFRNFGVFEVKKSVGTFSGPMPITKSNCSPWR